LELLSVRVNLQVQVLVHIALSQRDVVLEISKIVLSDEIVSFLVHPFDHMIPYFEVRIDVLLHDALLHVVVEIPCHHCDDFLGIIH